MRSLRAVQPALQLDVVGKQLAHRGVGGGDVVGVAGQRRPAERPDAAAEQRPHVGGHEAGVVEGARVAGGLRLGAQVVAVVDDGRAELLPLDHHRHLARHRRPCPLDVGLRIGGAQLGGLVERQVVRHVADERIVRGRLVGDDVRHDAAGAQLGVQLVGGHRRGRSSAPRRPTSPPRPRAARCRGRVRPGRGSASRRAARGGGGRRRRSGRRRPAWRRRAAARRPSRRSRRSRPAGRRASRRSAARRSPRTSRTCPARSPGCRCRSTTRRSSARTWSDRAPRAAGTRPSWPSRARGWSSRSARAAPSRACGRRPPGRPDCTSSVSSSASRFSVATMRWKSSQVRAALPVPPYTTRFAGSSATSGSRLFSSIRSAASWSHPRHRSSVPRAARMTGASAMAQSVAAPATARRGLYWALPADVAQLARASPCHGEGRGFESLHPLLESPAVRGFPRPRPRSERMPDPVSSGVRLRCVDVGVP